MTINLKQLIADREAGTPGEWIAYEFSADWYVANDSDDSGPMLRVGSWHDQRGANARRIARLPDLEAAFLEAVGLIQRTSEVIPEHTALRASLVDFLEKLK